MFRRYLSREIDQWVRSGLLQPAQGESLLYDHDRRHTGFNFSAVLAVLAAILFGAAVVALVAANWEAIARPVRVLMILLFIVGGLSAAAFAIQKSAHWVAEAALVFAILCFGAGIALVGQMYHLSGDEAAFMLGWTFGALVVSLVFSSATASISAGLLGLGYLFAVSSGLGVFSSADNFGVSVYGTVLAVMFAVGVAGWRSRSIVASHLCALMMICWIVWIVEGVSDLNPGYVLAAMGAGAFGFGSLMPSQWSVVFSRHGVVSAYGAVLLLGGLGLVQLDLGEVGLAGEMAFSALVLVASVVLLAVAGGDNRLIRRVAYFAFACETLYVVGETLGSLLGSAGFLFIGGLVLAVMAFAMMKIEKRFKKSEARS
ncbi:MAG: DUF2157 domain-containing protein [Hoeflea sp.]|uniref:DUF2157 domain-containing protein n=1 Tax=Hoeflea sp. TaxID=1940281 RepID=UPI003EF4FA38